MSRKNNTDKANRIAFVKLSVDKPKEGAAYLKSVAKELERCKNTKEVTECLNKVLFITPLTMFRDLGVY